MFVFKLEGHSEIEYLQSVYELDTEGSEFCDSSELSEQTLNLDYSAIIIC